MTNQEFGRKPNLLILGASGGVASALLQLLHTYRHEIGKLILLDKRNDATLSPYINHAKLNYSFVQMYINGHIPISELAALMRSEDVDITLDLTDSETLPILELCNKLSISYMNSSINIESMSVYELFIHLEKIRHTWNNAPHLVSMGMNPGIVNLWVMQGIHDHGVPEEIIEIEYDNAQVINQTQPIITWSKKQFLTESAWDPTGITTTGGKYATLLPNAFANQVDTTPYLKHIWPMAKYPTGMIVAHDEIMSLGTRFGIPAKFIYAINQPTLHSLQSTLSTQGNLQESDLSLADNTDINITGQDTIGIILKYPDKQVIYSNTMHHANFHGTNATLTQVAIGVLTGLKELIKGQLKHGINYPEDLSLYHTFSTLNSHMSIEKKVVKPLKKHAHTHTNPNASATKPLFAI